jgi:hypothetical protein
MTTQEKTSQLLSESSHSPSTTESMCYPSSWEALESFASIFASRMSYAGLDIESSSIAVLPQKKGFRNRRPPAIETSWDTMTTADCEPSSFQEPPSTPKNSQSGHFFGSSPRSVMDSPDSATNQFF